MIIDKSVFFGGRTGVIDERYSYPRILDSKEEIKIEGDTIEVLGRKINGPGRSIQSGKSFFVDENNDIAFIPDSISLLQRPSRFLSAIFELRKEIGYKPLIYAPGVSDPYLIPVLVYSGVSLFDDLFIKADSSKGRVYTPLGRTECEGDCLSRNLAFVKELLLALSTAIESGTLREVVEKYLISSRTVEILRTIDLKWYAESEEIYPVRTNYIKANSVDSLMRPDLRRYRDFIAERYVRPDKREIALIMPCSARKPYSASITHRRIMSRIEKFRPALHKLVVTSPVGLVPEELDETYPSRFYDIPTIGKWYEDEKMMIRSTLKNYLSRNKYEHVIAFITEDLSFISDSLPANSSVIQGNIKSDQLIESLRKELNEIPQVSLGQNNEKWKKEKLLSIAKYQFGSWIESYLTEMHVGRNYNQDMFIEDGKAMLVYNEKLGKLTITKDSGRIFLRENRFVVSIDDFKPTANVYAMGIVKTTEDIRQEDEVVLENGGDIRGIGIAKMPWKYMQDLQKGTAVKVRN